MAKRKTQRKPNTTDKNGNPISVETVSAVNVRGVNAIGAAIAAGYEAAATTGDAITVAVQRAETHYKGAPIPDADQDAIFDEVAKRRNWTKPGTKKSRKSEVKAILCAYTAIQRAVTGLKKKTNSCTWHDVVTMSRSLKGTKMQVANIKASVTKVVTMRKPSATKTNKATVNKKDAKKKAAIALQSILEYKKLPKDMRGYLAAVGMAFSLNLAKPYRELAEEYALDIEAE